jgi:hypothetical protein
MNKLRFLLILTSTSLAVAAKPQILEAKVGINGLTCSM